MSFILRNLTLFRRGVTVNKLQNFLFYSSNQENIVNSVYKEIGNEPSTIINYIQKYREHLTSENCLEILQRLSQYYSATNFQKISTSDKKDVVWVCNELDKKTNKLTFPQTIEAVELLCKIGISTHSIIFHSLLSKIQSEIKYNFDSVEKHVTQLQRILNEIKGSKFAINIQKDLLLLLKSRENVENSHLIEMCSNLYTLKNTNTAENTELISLILDGISKYPGDIRFTTAKSIFVSLLQTSSVVISRHEDLIKRLKSIMISRAYKFNAKDVNEILTAMVGTRNLDALYDEYLIDALVNSLLSNKEEILFLGKVIDMISKLQTIGHVQHNLLDFLIMEFFDDPSLLHKMRQEQMLSLVRGLSLYTDNPPFWDTIKRIIIENINYENTNNFFCTRLAYNLAVLDFFPDKLISHAFSTTRQQFEESYLSTQRRFLLLYQMVKSQHPTYSGIWPSPSVMKILFNLETTLNYESSNNENSMILRTLEKALGGSEYVKSNVETKYRQHIDHVIVMRKGGFPVAINLDDDSSFIEDIQAPPNSEIIGIICLSPARYLRNAKQLRRSVQAYIKSLEALKYKIVTIDLSKWRSLSEKEKIPFIMNHIRLKCPIENTTLFTR